MYFRHIAVSLTMLAGLAASVNAAPPYSPDLAAGGNRWTITAYNDASTVHQQWATQGLCFYPAGTNGSHQLYYWVSDTFPDWNGLAVQEGDQIFMHGDYAGDVGHDSMTWEITTASRANEGHGHWTEWREDGRYGRTIGFLNTALKRVGQCRMVTFAEALEVSRNLDHSFNERGELIVTPTGFSERELKEMLEQKD